MSVERVTHGGRDGDGSVLHGVDEAAAEADVALIENGALAGRGRPLRLVEAKREVLFGDVLESAGIVGLAMRVFTVSSASSSGACPEIQLGWTALSSCARSHG